jgi:hypothetical protein
MITAFLQFLDQKIPTAKICGRLGLSCAMAYWTNENGHDILDWINQEAKTEPTWGPSPCIDPPAHWSEFMRMFAMKFYPKQFAYA